MTEAPSAATVSATRRAAMRAVAGLFAGSPLVRAQLDPFRRHDRVPKLDELLDAFDFEAVAHARVPRSAYNYTAYGAESEFTLRRNREAFDWVKLVPSVTGPTAPDLGASLFGEKLDWPVMISPSAAQVALHPEGELAMHQGAASANTTMIISNVASYPVGKIAEAAKSPVWFQLYAKKDAAANRATLDEALAAGCKAVVVTVDQQASYFERSLHDRNLQQSGGPTIRRSTRQTTTNPYRLEDSRLWYTWDMITEVRKAIKVPLIVKGVLTAEDAKMAVDRGVDSVFVSNHGARGLDYSPSTLEVLPEIVEAVGGRVPVMFDSGVRRGSDILKALALGASVVCLGRVPRWGLAGYGAPGVQRVLGLLRAELSQAMAATGCANVASINRKVARVDFP